MDKLNINKIEYMRNNLTPIVGAIYIFFSSQLYSQTVSAGASGADGISRDSNQNPINLIGESKVGPPAALSDYSQGGSDGGNISRPPPLIFDGLVVTGDAGEDGESINSQFGTGAGGHGGASVIGGITAGGAGVASDGSAVGGSAGGSGGNVNGVDIQLSNSDLTGAAGGAGGLLIGIANGGTGVGGLGGGSVAAGISTGGTGGYSDFSLYQAKGGHSGNITGNSIAIIFSSLIGGAGGDGGNISSTYFNNGGGAGAAGHGGGSVFGGITTGGAAGLTYMESVPALGSGGDAGDVVGNSITLSTVQLDGTNAKGGDGGSFTATSNSAPLYGGGGAGGHGGGSVFGGISTGGAGGYAYADRKSTAAVGVGGSGGAVQQNSIKISNSILDGGLGGAGGSVGAQATSTVYGGGGAAGHGGGSVFGGISTGGAGGYASGIATASADGGNGGDVSGNSIEIIATKLTGAAAGVGGMNSNNTSYSQGAAGYGGGSIFGGISTGGAGGFANAPTVSANGGDGGNASNNKISISGQTILTGDIYGGVSRGGDRGQYQIGSDPVQYGQFGLGGLTQNNTITFIDSQSTIQGALYGGLSVDGGGDNIDDLTYSTYYKGNTLNVQNSHITVGGSIKNIQNYNWLLPVDEFDGDTIVTIDDTTGTPVDLNNTVHSVDVQATGNTLNSGDKVVLISRAIGTPALSAGGTGSRSGLYIEQGFFIVYDASMDVEQYSGKDALVLNVLGTTDSNPDGKIHPESEEFLKGRIAQLAMVDQGADMISDGVSYARASLRKENANFFAIVDGGSSKYKNGGISTLKLNDMKLALGAAKAWELKSKSVGMIAAFIEHGNGNYSSYNNFDYFGDTRGSGKVRYNGLGLMFHMDVANTGNSKIQNKPNIFDDKYGLYLDAALRFGHIKVDFHSADMTKGAGVEARYNTKSRYTSAMAGVGYVWTLDEKSAVDFYGRFTFSRMNGKDIQVIDEQMTAGAAHSKRLRLGARYGYAYSNTTTPYVGLAYERNFTGDVSGSAYGFTIKETSLKGNTGIVEAGLMIKPKGADDPFSLLMGVQGHFAQRKGISASVRARYVF